VITNQPDRDPSAQRVISASGPLATVVAAALAGAGLIHLAFAPVHLQESTTHGAFFVAAAWAQLLLAGLILTRRGGRATLAATVAVQAAIIGVWVVSRTSGISGEVEPVAFPDALASLLEFIAICGSSLLLLGWHGPRVRSFIGGVVTTLSAVVVMGLVTMSVSPALGGGHSHGAAGHDHASAAGHAHSHASGASGATGSDGHDHAHAATAAGATGNFSADGHDHGAIAAGTAIVATHDHSAPAGPTDTTTAPHDHGTTGTTVPGTDPCAHQITSLTDPCLTPAQVAAAQTLIDRSTTFMAPFTAIKTGRTALAAALNAAGFESIGDSGTGFEHYVNWTYYNDGIELDPTRIEAVVLQKLSTGQWIAASAMYILNPGKTMADAPDIAGSLTSWHDHQNLCWDASGHHLAGILVNGTCTGGTFAATPPMLHVWMTPQVCGPFTGTEGVGGNCAVHQH
jgi:hypothetical protein